MFITNKNYNDLFKKANICLDILKEWCDYKSLQLNLSKPKYVAFNITNFNSIYNISTDLYENILIIVNIKMYRVIFFHLEH